jgi:hypothetical protein
VKDTQFFAYVDFHLDSLSYSNDSRDEIGL